MFEGLVAGLLRQYLGQYVKNLDFDQLDISVWSGEVVLERIELRTDALGFLNLPIAIKAGYIGKLTLSIAWNALGSKPVVVKVEDVYLIVGPQSECNYDEEQEKTAAADRKLLQLERLNNAPAVSSDEAALNVTLVSKIVDNIQVSIQRVHLRYEDSVTSAGRPFVAGLHIRELSAKSTDGQWQVQFVVGASTVHKLARLDGFGVYLSVLDSPAARRARSLAVVSGGDGDSTSAAALAALGWSLYQMGTVFTHTAGSSSSNGGDGVTYLLPPLSAQLKVTMAKGDYPEPKVDASVAVDALDVVITREQYIVALDLLEYFGAYGKYDKYRKYRPQVSRLEAPAQWWRYALNCTLHDARQERAEARRATWVLCQRKRYLSLYTRTLTAAAAWSACLSDAEHSELESIERDPRMLFKDILFLRAAAEAEVRATLTRTQGQAAAARADVRIRRDPEAEEAAKKAARKKRQKAKGWFASWRSSGEEEAKAEAEEEAKAAAARAAIPRFTDEDRARLFATLEYDPESAEQEFAERQGQLPPSYLSLRLNAVLHRGSLTLQGPSPSSAVVPSPTASDASVASSRELLCLQFLGASLCVTQRKHGMALDAALSRFRVRDSATAGTVFPWVVDSHATASDADADVATGAALVSGKQGEQAPLLRVSVDMQPLDGSADMVVDCVLHPLSVVVHSQWIATVSQFVAPPRAVDLSVYGDLAVAAASSAAARSRESVNRLLATHRTMTLHVSAAAPTILLPHHPCVADTAVAVLNLGRFSLASTATDTVSTPTAADTGGESEGDKGEGEQRSAAVRRMLDAAGGTLDSASPQLLGRCYDHYYLQAEGITLFQATRDPDAAAEAAAGAEEAVEQSLGLFNKRCLLQPMSFRVDLLLCSLPPDVGLPKTKFTASFPGMHFTLSTSALRQLCTLASLWIQSPLLTGAATAATAAHQPASAAADGSGGALVFHGSSGHALEHQAPPVAAKALPPRSEGAFVQLLASVVISELSLTLTSDLAPRCPPQRLLTLRILGAHAVARQRTFDLSAACSLHNLQVVDCVSGWGPEFDLLLSAHTQQGQGQGPGQRHTPVLLGSGDSDADAKARLTALCLPSGSEHQHSGSNHFMSAGFSQHHQLSPDYCGTASTLSLQFQDLRMGVNDAAVAEILRVTTAEVLPALALLAPPLPPQQLPVPAATPTAAAPPFGESKVASATGSGAGDDDDYDYDDDDEDDNLFFDTQSAPPPARQLYRQALLAASAAALSKDAETEADLPSHKTTLAITGSWRTLELSLNTRGRGLTRASIRGLSASLSLCPEGDSKTLSASLGSVQLTDLRAGALYPLVFAPLCDAADPAVDADAVAGIENDARDAAAPLLQLAFSMRTLPPLQLEVQKGQQLASGSGSGGSGGAVTAITCDVTVAAMRLIVLNRFISTLTAYFLSGPLLTQATAAADASASLAAAAAAASSSQVAGESGTSGGAVTAATSATDTAAMIAAAAAAPAADATAALAAAARVTLDIRVSVGSLLVWLPRSSQSASVLQLGLGSVQLTAATQTELYNGAPVHSIAFTSRSLCAQYGTAGAQSQPLSPTDTGDGSGTDSRVVLHLPDLDASVLVNATDAGVDVTVAGRHGCVRLSQRDVFQLLQLLSCNLGEEGDSAETVSPQLISRRASTNAAAAAAAAAVAAEAPSATATNGRGQQNVAPPQTAAAADADAAAAAVASGAVDSRPPWRFTLKPMPLQVHLFQEKAVTQQRLLALSLDINGISLTAAAAAAAAATAAGGGSGGGGDSAGGLGVALTVQSVFLLLHRDLARDAPLLPPRPILAISHAAPATAFTPPPPPESTISAPALPPPPPSTAAAAPAATPGNGSGGAGAGAGLCALLSVSGAGVTTVGAQVHSVKAYVLCIPGLLRLVDLFTPSADVAQVQRPAGATAAALDLHAASASAARQSQSQQPQPQQATVVPAVRSGSADPTLLDVRFSVVSVEVSLYTAPLAAPAPSLQQQQQSAAVTIAREVATGTDTAALSALSPSASASPEEALPNCLFFSLPLSLSMQQRQSGQLMLEAELRLDGFYAHNSQPVVVCVERRSGAVVPTSSFQQMLALSAHSGGDTGSGDTGSGDTGSGDSEDVSGGCDMHVQCDALAEDLHPFLCLRVGCGLTLDPSPGGAGLEVDVCATQPVAATLCPELIGVVNTALAVVSAGLAASKLSTAQPSELLPAALGGDGDGDTAAPVVSPVAINPPPPPPSSSPSSPSQRMRVAMELPSLSLAILRNRGRATSAARARTQELGAEAAAGGSARGLLAVCVTGVSLMLDQGPAAEEAAADGATANSTGYESSGSGEEGEAEEGSCLSVVATVGSLSVRDRREHTVTGSRDVIGTLASATTTTTTPATPPPAPTTTAAAAATASPAAVEAAEAARVAAAAASALGGKPQLELSYSFRAGSVDPCHKLLLSLRQLQVSVGADLMVDTVAFGSEVVADIARSSQGIATTAANLQHRAPHSGGEAAATAGADDAVAAPAAAAAAAAAPVLPGLEIEARSVNHSFMLVAALPLDDNPARHRVICVATTGSVTLTAQQSSSSPHAAGRPHSELQLTLDLSEFNCLLGPPRAPVPLLQPHSALAASLVLRQTPPAGNDGGGGGGGGSWAPVQLAGRASGVHLFLVPSDVLTVTEFVGALQDTLSQLQQSAAPAAAAAAALETAGTAPALLADGDGSGEAKGELASLDASTDTPVAAEQAQAASAMVIAFEVTGLSITLARLVSGHTTPLLRVALPTATLNACASTAEARVTVQAEYYDPGRVVWEPVVEPWEVTLHGSRASDGGLHASVLATQRLQLVLTVPLTTALLSASQVLTQAVQATTASAASTAAAAAAKRLPAIADEGKEGESSDPFAASLPLQEASAPRFLPYQFVNRTRLPLKFWFPKADKPRQVAGSLWSLAAGDSVMFGLPQELVSRASGGGGHSGAVASGGAASQRALQNTVNMTLDGFQTSYRLPVDKIGSVLKSTMPAIGSAFAQPQPTSGSGSNSGSIISGAQSASRRGGRRWRDFHYVWSVAAVDGIKVVTLAPRLSVVNNTPSPISVRYLPLFGAGQDETSGGSGEAKSPAAARALSGAGAEDDAEAGGDGGADAGGGVPEGILAAVGEETVTLQPQQQLWLPLLCDEKCSLQLRPATAAPTTAAAAATSAGGGGEGAAVTGMQFGWSSPMHLASRSFWRRRSRSVRYRPAAAPASPSQGGGGGGAQALAGLEGTYHLTLTMQRNGVGSVSVLPPLELVNVLACPVTFSFARSSAGGRPEKRGTLAPGASVDLYTLASVTEDPLCFRLRIPGFRWSNWYPACSDGLRSELLKRNRGRGGSSGGGGSGGDGSDGNARLFRQLPVEDDMGRPITLLVDTVLLGPHNRVYLTLYVRYWVTNNSGLPLLYSHPGAQRADGVEIAAGQMVEATEETFENQRYVPLSGWSDGMLPTDRYAWSDKDGLCGSLRTKDRFALPSAAWHWADEWSVEITRGVTDREGWQYNSSFASSEWLPDAGWNSVVRRRRWTRRRVPDSSSTFTMYSPHAIAKDSVRVKVADSQWSDALSLATAGTRGLLDVCEHSGGRSGRRYQLSVAVDTKVRAFGGMLHRTKIVTFSPRLIVVNHTGSTLHYRQTGTAVNHSLEAGKVAPFHWPLATAAQQMCVGVPGYHWSAAFLVTEVGRHCVRLLQQAAGGSGPPTTPAAGTAAVSGAQQLQLRVEVKEHSVSGSAVVLVTSEGDNLPIYRIENKCLDAVKYYQKGTPTHLWPPESLQPGDSRPFAWSELLCSPRRLEVGVGRTVRTLDLEDVTTHLEIKLQADSGFTQDLSSSAAGAGGASSREPVLFNQSLVFTTAQDRKSWFAYSGTFHWMCDRSPVQLSMLRFEPATVMAGAKMGGGSARATSAFVPTSGVGGIGCLAMGIFAPTHKAERRRNRAAARRSGSGAGRTHSGGRSGGDGSSGSGEVRLGDFVHVTHRLPTGEKLMLYPGRAGDLRWVTREDLPTADANKVVFEVVGPTSAKKGSVLTAGQHFALRSLYYRGSLCSTEFSSSNPLHASFVGQRNTCTMPTPPRRSQGRGRSGSGSGSGSDTPSLTTQPASARGLPLPDERHWLTAQTLQTSCLPPRTVYVYLTFDGPTRVLRFSTSEDPSRVKAPTAAKDKSGGRPSASSFDESESSPAARSAAGYSEHKAGGDGEAEAEAEAEASVVHKLMLSVSLAGVGVSVINSHPRELLYLTLDGLSFEVDDNSVQRSLELHLGRLQIDNQTPTATPDYQVVLQPTPSASASASAARALLDAVVVLKAGTPPGITHVRYAALGLQEVTVRVDEELIHHLYNLAMDIQDATSHLLTADHPAAAAAAASASTAALPAGIGSAVASGGSGGSRSVQHELQEFITQCGGGQAVGAAEAAEGSQASPSPPPLLRAMSSAFMTASSMFYFELLQLNALKLSVSFQRTPADTMLADARRDDGSGGGGGGIAGRWLDAVGIIVSSIDNAPLKFNALLLQNPFLTTGELGERLVSHYRRQALRQVLGVMGSFEFLGNPVGVMGEMGSGAHDFFHDPASGSVKSPGEFLKGSVTGSGSLITSTMRGVGLAATGITSSVGKGVASLSMDAAYMRRRKELEQRQGATTMAGGAFQGAKQLGVGVASGVTGIFTKPVEGARKGGMGGFVKGVGVGLIGAVVKPVAGVVDLGTKTAEGAMGGGTADRRRARMATRQRPPRLLRGADRIVVPYREGEERVVRAVLQQLGVAHEVQWKGADLSNSNATPAAAAAANAGSGGGAGQEVYMNHMAFPSTPLLLLLTTSRCCLVLHSPLSAEQQQQAEEEAAADDAAAAAAATAAAANSASGRASKAAKKAAKTASGTLSFFLGTAAGRSSRTGSNARSVPRVLWEAPHTATQRHAFAANGDAMAAAAAAAAGGLSGSALAEAMHLQAVTSMSLPDGTALPAADALFHRKSAALRARADGGAAALGIRPQEVAGWQPAVAALTRVAAWRSPSRNVEDLLDAMASINDSFVAARPGKSMAADDLFPVFLYALVQADVRQPLLLLLLIQLTCADSLRGECGYAVTTMEAATRKLVAFTPPQE